MFQKKAGGERMSERNVQNDNAEPASSGLLLSVEPLPGDESANNLKFSTDDTDASDSAADTDGTDQTEGDGTDGTDGASADTDATDTESTDADGTDSTVDADSVDA
jgi:hypothetical protein